MKKGKLVHDVYIKIYYGDQSFKTDFLNQSKGKNSSTAITVNGNFKFDHPIIVCDSNSNTKNTKNANTNLKNNHPKLNNDNSESLNHKKHNVMSSVSDISIDRKQLIGKHVHHGSKSKSKNKSSKTDSLTKSLISKQARQEIIIKLKQKHRFGRNISLAAYSISIANLQIGFGGVMKSQYVDLIDDKGQVIASLSISISIVNKN